MNRSAEPMLTSLAPGRIVAVRIAFDLVVEGVVAPQKFVDLEAEDDIGLGDHGPGAVALIERVPAREIHAAAEIDHRRLQQLGQLDQARHAGLACARSGRR